MGRFLDLRSSMNAGVNINTALTAPFLWGIVGLQTQNVPSAINDLTGSIGLQGNPTGRARITVHRGPAFTDPVVYTSDVTLATTDNEIIPVDAEDLIAPAALQTTYAAFISLLVGAVSRIGPETFWGISSDGR